jgi:PPP family 3-phenylpropionic acid transporter
VVPYWRLSGFYLGYFAVVGAFVPYWGLYLQSLGYAPAAIGALIAVHMATKIVAPNLWGWLADRDGRRIGIVRLALFAAGLLFSGVLMVQGFWPLALVLAGFSFFWHAALPQLEATTLNHLGSGTHHYSRIRLWGSIGFILTAVLLGPLLGRFGVGLLPYLLLGLLALTVLAALRVPEGRPAPARGAPVSLRATLRGPAVIALLAACVLHQAGHGPYYAFFSIHLEAQGYARALVGQLWALGVIAEIGVFLLAHRWLPRFGATTLLALAAGLTALRWLLIAGFVDWLAVLLFAQLMHAASYGLFHAAAIDLIHRLFPGRVQGRGQALYSSMSFGLGGASGSLASGYLWEGLGPFWTFVCASGVGLLALACTLWLARVLRADPRTPVPG